MDTKTCLLPFKNSYPGLKGTEQNVNRVYSCNDKGINALGATQQPKTTDCCVHIPKFKIAQSKFKNASCVCVHLQTVKLWDGSHLSINTESTKQKTGVGSVWHTEHKDSVLLLEDWEGGTFSKFYWNTVRCSSVSCFSNCSRPSWINGAQNRPCTGFTDFIMLHHLSRIDDHCRSLA